VLTATAQPHAVVTVESGATPITVLVDRLVVHHIMADPGHTCSALRTMYRIPNKRTIFSLILDMFH